MSNNNSRFPRGLRVLITMVILGILIWRFAINTPYYYYSIGAAVLVTAVVIYFTYRKSSAAKPKVQKVDEELLAESDAEISVFEEIESDILNSGDISIPAGGVKAGQPKSSQGPVEGGLSEESPVPLIDDQSSLTLDEENTLVNAIWYRCENPYCKYTSFLRVHHIVEEKEGGNNKLDNLIVLCPFCHDLAHRGEIPEKEMRTWIDNRSERWKFKPQWKHF
jgi:hypothetical protein